MKEPDFTRIIWKRTLVMLFVTMRFDIEARFIQHRCTPQDQDYALRFTKCVIQCESLFYLLSPQERSLLLCKMGTWKPRDVFQYSWHIEGIACCLWALNALDTIPPHDGSCDMNGIDKFFESFSGGYTSFLNDEMYDKKFILRERSEIEWELKRSEIVYQRGLLSLSLRQGRIKHVLDRYSNFFPFEQYNLPIGPSGDLMVYGKEYCDLSVHDEMQIMPLAAIRIQSFHWILNPDLDWDSITPAYVTPITPKN